MIKENEKRLTEETVEKDKETYLSSRHFRNEIYNYKQMFWKDFVQLAEKTWPGLRLNEINYDPIADLLSLYITDIDFYAEIGLMGSGLQMWLQIIWFLARKKLERGRLKSSNEGWLLSSVLYMASPNFCRNSARK